MLKRLLIQLEIPLPRPVLGLLNSGASHAKPPPVTTIYHADLATVY
jgi:hypothetical protein